MRVNLILPVEYDPEHTDTLSLASAIDLLIENALSTAGIMDEHGDVSVFETEIPEAAAERDHAVRMFGYHGWEQKLLGPLTAEEARGIVERSNNSAVAVKLQAPNAELLGREEGTAGGAKVIRRRFHGGTENVDFAYFARAVVQEDNVAAEIAQRMLDGDDPYEYGAEDMPQVFETFEIIDREGLIAALAAEAEPSS